MAKIPTFLAIALATCLVFQAGLAAASEITGTLSSGNGTSTAINGTGTIASPQFSVVDPEQGQPSSTDMATWFKLGAVAATIVIALGVIFWPRFQRKKQPPLGIAR